MYAYRLKYMIQTRKPSGAYSQGIVWAVYPQDFRNFLSYVNGERVSCAIPSPDFRIKRLPDDTAPNYVWPDDAVFD